MAGWPSIFMGSPTYVSKHGGLARHPDHPARKLLLRLKVKGKG